MLPTVAERGMEVLVRRVWRPKDIVGFAAKDRIMGITYVEGQVKGASGKQENVKFLVDSGATYSLLPKAVWEALELTLKRKPSFTLTGRCWVS